MSPLASDRDMLLSMDASATPQPPALAVRVLGMCEVFRDGKLLDMSDWKYTRARDLLLLLLLYGDQSRSEMIETLWPGADAARARNRLNVTLHFMRKALGSGSWIQYADGRYRFQRAGPFTLDLEQFDQHVASARACAAQEPAQAVAYLHDAMALVRDDLCTNVRDLPWIEPARRAAQQRVLEALVLLGNLQMEIGSIQAAVESYAHALQYDPYEEAIYRGLMRAHAQRGDRIQIMQVYGYCQELLHDDRGLPPSESTRGLYATLLDGLPHGAG